MKREVVGQQGRECDYKKHRYPIPTKLSMTTAPDAAAAMTTVHVGGVPHTLIFQHLDPRKGLNSSKIYFSKKASSHFKSKVRHVQKKKAGMNLFFKACINLVCCNAKSCVVVGVEKISTFYHETLFLVRQGKLLLYEGNAQHD